MEVTESMRLAEHEIRRQLFLRTDGYGGITRYIDEVLKELDRYRTNKNNDRPARIASANVDKDEQQ